MKREIYVAICGGNKGGKGGDSLVDVHAKS